jgi:hypothetical protein
MGTIGAAGCTGGHSGPLHWKSRVKVPRRVVDTTAVAPPAGTWLPSTVSRRFAMRSHFATPAHPEGHGHLEA